ncbi:alpha/beta fold hydrolase [Lacisediminimonas profundi]|uniref:alpha/beta fold hydrolase n=1 Tax=Lacisediminimonas profundi TaxID=2603856 RepID=UPI001386FE3B|nr:alpha/beta hydrolase [Lacisediminimonas profundi]
MTAATISRVRGAAGATGAANEIALHTWGAPDAPVVLLAHSILASSMMWERQGALLAQQGFRAIAMDTRGHGGSDAPVPPYSMDDLAADTVAVMDALKIERAHYIGLSLGGMSGFGLGISHGERLLSMVLCDARADAPAPFAAVWDDRIAAAREHGCQVLATATAERWFGRDFMERNPDVAQRFLATIGATSIAGFIGCAQAIQGLDYLKDVQRIKVPVTLVVGSKDVPLPDAMIDIQSRIAGAKIEIIADAGHLPNIDQPDAFDAALLRHFAQFAPR